ncbi:hypothetical protein [Saccharopolyspora tripterygii]
MSIPVATRSDASPRGGAPTWLAVLAITTFVVARPYPAPAVLPHT